ncbi:hypothetical protein ACW9HR_22130 [Nocardia gipuzkoensis]
MIDTGSGVPTLTPSDIIGGKEQVNEILFRIVRNHVHLRYSLRIDRHTPQCSFTVDAYHPSGHRWHPLWCIPPRTYHFAEGREPEEVTDPQSAMIARPNSDEIHRKAASWQKIVNALSRVALALVGSA